MFQDSLPNSTRTQSYVSEKSEKKLQLFKHLNYLKDGPTPPPSPPASVLSYQYPLPSYKKKYIGPQLDPYTDPDLKRIKKATETIRNFKFNKPIVYKKSNVKRFQLPIKLPIQLPIQNNIIKYVNSLKSIPNTILDSIQDTIQDTIRDTTDTIPDYMDMDTIQESDSDTEIYSDSDSDYGSPIAPNLFDSSKPLPSLMSSLSKPSIFSQFSINQSSYQPTNSSGSFTRRNYDYKLDPLPRKITPPPSSPASITSNK